MESRERKLVTYTTPSGKTPLEDWLKSLRDKKSKARVLNRIDRLRLGNFGDCKSVGTGVFELRIHIGPGFRVYFALNGEELVILLCGGDKKSQRKDILNAIEYLKEYKSHGN